MSDSYIQSGGGLRYAAWHPLLVQTLNKCLIDGVSHTSGHLPSILAILASLPITKDSHAAIDIVLPKLRSFLQKFPLDDVIRQETSSTDAICDDQRLLLESPTSDFIVKRNSTHKRRTVKRSGRKLNKTETADESETDRPPYRRIKTVHIHECVLLSDSDGFAAYIGDIPPAGYGMNRDKIDDNSMYVIYRDIFGFFPTFFNPLETLINAITVFAAFSMTAGIETGISFLCEILGASGDFMLQENIMASLLLCRQWMNWQRIVRQVTRSVSVLARASGSFLGTDINAVLNTSAVMLLNHIKKNICASTRLSISYTGVAVIDDVHIASIDEVLRTTNEITLCMLDDVLSLISISVDKTHLVAVGSNIISWAEDPCFSDIVGRLIDSLESRLHLQTTDSLEENRFAFELFASLVDVPSVSSYILHWCLFLPSGFNKTVTGLEIIASLITQFSESTDMCAKIIRRHLPFTEWSHTAPSSGCTSVATFPSSIVVELSKVLKAAHLSDLLVQICSLVLPYCSNLLDIEYLLIDAVIPAIVDLCEKCRHGRDIEDDIVLAGEMTSETKGVLKRLELLAAHLKTSDAAAEVIRLIVVPYRDFYFAAFELQDVFVAVCAKAIRLSPDIAAETGLSQWIVDRLDSCIRHASIDIWTFVGDSAAKYFKLLLSTLNLIRDILEDNRDVFSSLATRLLACSSTVVDLCFEWMGSPSEEYRGAWRIGEAMSKALSIHLMLHRDVADVERRFSTGLLKAFGLFPPSCLISCIVCALLDRCVSRLPPSIGNVISIEQESEDDALMGDGGNVILTQRRSIIHPELVSTTINIVSTVLDMLNKLDDTLEFMIQKICKKLFMIDKHSQNGVQWLPRLFPFCEVIIRREVSSSVFKTVLELVVAFIKRDPKSDDINCLIGYLFQSNNLKETVLQSLNILLTAEDVEPPVCLVFPQPAVNQPVEIKKVEDIVNETLKTEHEEQEKNSSGSKILSAVERFLTANRSDGETETERRREKKKHLRNQVRGSSMVAMDRISESDEKLLQSPLSPTLIVNNGAAASFVLGDSHQITATDGLTISMWMKRILHTKLAASKLVPLHLITLSGTELSCSFSITTKGHILFNISLGDLKLGRHKLKGVAKEGKWTHIIIGMRITAESITVQSMIGDSSTTYDVPLLVRLSQQSFPLTVSFGCIKRRFHHQYYLSTIFGFKGLLPPGCALMLIGLGCQLSSLSETQVEHLCPNMSNILNHRLIYAKQATVEAVRLDPAKFVQKLQRAMIFVIRATSAHSYAVSVLPSDIEPSFLIGQSALRLAHLKDFPINWYGRLVQHYNPFVDKALHPLGGLKLLVYLYMKCVNDSLPALTQRIALDMLLRYLQRGSMYTDTSTKLKVNSLLARTLASSLAVIDDSIVELLLRYCIKWTESSVDLDDSLPLGESRLDPFKAVIRDPSLLLALCTHSEVWHGSRFYYWRRVISAIATVLNPASCRILFKFNRFQLTSLNMLPKFLHCLLEMIQDPIEFGDFPLEDSFVDDVVSIVQALLGFPELPQPVTHLWHFVFLSHPASFTYIDHKVQGHSEWLKAEFIRDDVEGELLGDSELCQTLKHYLQVLGKESIAELWQRGTTLFEIRRQFEHLMTASGDIANVDERIIEKNGTRNTMPDLISDIPSFPMGMNSATVENTRSKFIPPCHGHKTECRWVIAVRAGLMNVMAAVLQNGADSLLSCMQHDVISWQAIVVLMSHQTDVRIRNAVAEMLEKFLIRAPPFPKMAFLRLSGFQILANQLRSQPVTAPIVDSLFSMMCGETVRLGDGLDQSHLVNMSVDRMSCESLHAIFVAFEESVLDPSLFWNISNALLKTFENNVQLQQAMVDCQLVDAMVNTLRRIAYLDKPSEYDVCSDRPHVSLQLEGWSSFSQRIVISSVPYCEPRLNQACERFIWLLILADIQAVRDHRYPLEKRLRAHRIIRGQLCQLLHCWMEAIRTVFSVEGRSASATSSRHSINEPPESSCSSQYDEFDYCDDAIITPERANMLEGTSPVAAFIAGSFANLKEKIFPLSRRTLKCSYPKRQGPSPLAPIDALNERMLFVLDANATVFSILTPTDCVTEEEENLFHFYLYFMLSSWKRDQQPTLRTSTSSQSPIWQRLVTMCRDRVRVLLAQLVAFVLFPAHRKLHEAAVVTRSDVDMIPNWQSDWVEEKRRQIVKALAHELQYKQTLYSLLNVNLDYEYALCLGLYEMAILSPLKSDCEEEIDRMIRFLNNCKVGLSFERFTADSLHNLTTDEILSLHSYSQHRKSVMAQLRSKLEAIKDGEEKHTAQISEVAIAVTCEVVEEQSLNRKIFIKATKAGISEFIEAEKVMEQIAKEICHPEAAGFESSHWPIGWALDPTEGPMRERRRLMPYYYAFNPRFFQDERREDIKNNSSEQALAKLLQNPLSTRSVVEKAMVDEQIQLFLDVTVLRGTFECQGELLMGKSHLHFVGETAKSTQKGTECSVIKLSWRYDQLSEIQARNHLLKDVAMEMFISNGDTYLVVFHNSQNRSQFKAKLIELDLSHLFPSTEHMLHTVVQAWRHGNITNFEYLMHLNKLAGRSFNDLMQYPVFPFILADYTSSVLDLNNPSSFRNLSKPMAIQDKKMESHYVANYSCLQAECARTSSDIAPLHFGPYHYGSHYSNSGIVVHYLVRLSPFTQIALEYQDHSFDIPDRLFNSIEATWRLSSSESTTDFKELIPEFFCLPEFLENRDQLDLGIRQGGERVMGVKLPVWVPENNSRLFVLIHRQALEASIVSQNLHAWVDLIFGYKQTGKAALEAINVFHPATYLGHLNADELSDELSQSALRTMVRSYGQMPMQILQTPHQPHLHAGKEGREKSRAPSPVPSILGVRWGDYVGSPEQESSHIQTVLSLKGLKSDRLARVITIPNGSVVGVPRGTLLITKTSADNVKDPLAKSRTVDVLAALSWAFSDTVLRFRLIKPELKPWVNIMELDSFEISSIEFSSMNSLLFIAFSSGLIKIYQLDFDVQGMNSISMTCDLLAHHSSVSALCVCDEYSIAVSGSNDGKVVVWDTNRLSFVRLLRPSSSAAVTAMCVSRTSADIAIVSQQGYGSRVELYTVNGDRVGEVDTDSTVICLSMTNQSEGTAINCMALGMQNGHILLVEMWCLSVVRDIYHENHLEPIISVEYTSGGRKLFAALATNTGRVLCWQSVTNMSRVKIPQFQIISPYDPT